MKEVKPEQFQKKNPEDVQFVAASFPDTPPRATLKRSAQPRLEQESERTNETTNERTKQRTNVRYIETASTQPYCIEIPIERLKTRQSFDIFADQKTALNKIQLAMMDAGQKKKPVLGDMVQEAIDLYIRDKVKKLGNIQIVKEPAARTNGRTNETTNERSFEPIHE